MEILRNDNLHQVINKAPNVLAKIRILGTTDIHANLLPYDYFSGASDQPYGLARLATMIRQARSEVQNVLLFDNGDALQGTPLGDITAQGGSGWNEAHPVISAMNMLEYDAATIGNHEFNFGLDWLTNALSQANYPVTCANIETTTGEDFLPPFLLVDREITDNDGQLHTLRIGIIGLVPPQISTWDRFHLEGKLESHDMVLTARRLVPALRHSGADLIVLLAHTGIDDSPEHPFMENAAMPLAAIEGVDAIVTGHSHELFPDKTASTSRGIDSSKGTLNGTPAVMAGFRGSHLGVIDLEITRCDGTWQVTAHKSEARPVKSSQGTGLASADVLMSKSLKDAHAATVKLTSAPIGHSKTPLHTYLAMIECNAALQMVTQAQKVELSRLVQGTRHAGLPVLSASAPFKTGGRGGPEHYTDIPPGSMTIRNAANLYPFPNTLCGLRLTGAELKDWLERAAICFNQITPGEDDQLLCNPAAPGHNFDMIDGLTYQINLSRPAKYLPNGEILNALNSRVEMLRYEGEPVKNDAEFLLATNSYRAYGGGPYRTMPESAFVHIGDTQIRDVLVRNLSSSNLNTGSVDPSWCFTPLPNTSVIFETGPGIRNYAQELVRIRAEDCGDTDAGFARLRLSL